MRPRADADNQNSISPPLNDEEKRLFEHMHESRPYYGNLPAAMLAERMQGLKLGVLAIWNDPQESSPRGRIAPTAALLRGNGAESPPGRLAVKKAMPARHTRGREKVDATDRGGGNMAKPAVSGDRPPAPGPRAGGPFQFIENLHSLGPAAQAALREVAVHIRQLHGIECQAGCTQWEYHCEGDSEESVKIQLRCECGAVDGTICMPFNEIAKYAEQLLQWPRPAPDNPSADDAQPVGDS